MKKAILRYWSNFYIIGWLALFCLVSIQAFASHSTKTSSLSGEPLTPDQEKYTQAYFRLRYGSWYSIAIEELEEAVRLEPKQSPYYVALGCAYAGRAASIGDAANHLEAYKRDQEKYRQWVSEWEAGQQHQSHPLFGKPRPEPPLLRTKDDSRPFSLTKTEAAAKYRLFTKKALVAWETALSLAKSRKQKAEALDAYGWGVLLLRRFGWGLLAEDELPDNQKAREAFKSLTQMFPSDARYWQSFGDALTHETTTPPLELAGIVAYQQALKRQARNVALWYRLYGLCRETDAELAEKALRQAALIDSDNAYPLYRIGGLLLYKTPYSEFERSVQQTVRAEVEGMVSDLKAGRITEEELANGKFSPTASRITQESEADIAQRVLGSPSTAESRTIALEAIQYIERGNRSRYFNLPEYLSPVYQLLLPAWKFRKQVEIEPLAVTSWGTVTGSTRGYARISVLQGKGQEAVRAVQAFLGFSYRLLGNLDEKRLPLTANNSIALYLGARFIKDAYSSLQEIYHELGEDINTDKIRAEKEAFQRRYQEFRKADLMIKSRSYGDY